MCMMCKRLSFVYSYLSPATGVEDKDRQRGPAPIIASCCFGVRISDPPVIQMQKTVLSILSGGSI